MKLPPGIEVTAQWYSYDDGLTWTRFPSVEQIKDASERRAYVNRMTVTKVDHDRGEITVQVES